MGQVSTSARPDPREVPTYTLAEAAYYLAVPYATLRSWFLGRHYPVAAGKKFFAPIIEIADKKKQRLSFINLVEAHVLNAIRREHEIQLPKVRKAVTYLRNKLQSRHPLADQQFETDGLDLFVQKYGELINITRDGQLAMRNVLQSFLKRRDRRSDPLRAPQSRLMKLFSLLTAHSEERLSPTRCATPGHGWRFTTIISCRTRKTRNGSNTSARETGWC